MRTLCFIAAIVLFASCSGGSAASKQLSGSDSLVVNFLKSGTNEVVKSVATAETIAIKKVIRFVGGKETEQYKCGYDGVLMFYKKGELISDVAFNYSGEGCRHFLSTVEGELMATAMSNEAADFLKSLVAGKNWY